MSHPASTPAAPPESLPPAPAASPAGGQDPERYWLEHVYKGGSRQLTVRAVIAGMLIGMVMCLSNLYVILKTGWSMGVTITACILAFAVFSGLKGLGLFKKEFSPLENNAMGSVASAAGYMTGGGNMAAVPALLLLTGTLPSAGWLVVWFAVISALGVFAAIPIKRQLVNIEALPFPTGTATAATINALHGHGEEARGKAWLLGGAGLLGAFVAMLRELRSVWLSTHAPSWLQPPLIPSKLSVPFLSIRGRPAGDWGLSFDLSLLLIGAGALMNWKTGWSLLLGALLTYGFLAPAMVDQGYIAEVSFKAINTWTLWTGAAMLVSSGVLSFAFQWRSVARSFKALSGLFGKKDEGAAADPLAGIECPPAWFPLGFAVLGPVAVGLMAYLFQIPVWAGVLALPLAVVMGVIAARVTGETDTTPTKALGPVTQLVYGGLAPGNVAANVMSANATGGVGLHAADLLTDLKSGWLLGANPRQQFIGQLFGVVAGAAIVVPVFKLLVPDASVLGSEDFPAPGVLVWAGVSKMLSVGLQALHPSARVGALCGALLGVALVLLDRWAPKAAKPYIPSPSGFGLSIVLPGSSSISFFIGAAIAEVLRRRKPKLAEAAVMPVGSGFIAGESLMGIALVMLKAFKYMPK
ncbi:OPT family oligopeptide transporter [Stigmatella erecta]|uniref:Oligopeptide transporter, OPT superfamily n=1 Tax=Stigmatella erecta TaxID=83460 RepID=A0A1I0JJW3_9BACT|nr:OPT family oligopeptide transporter [Stigmatella erecta]SEU09936.1 oligopeptide transporter, OPT superfamily [Stigmatella erecta]